MGKKSRLSKIMDTKEYPTKSRAKAEIEAEKSREEKRSELSELGQKAAETAIDVAKVVPQAITFNWADEILEMAGMPELGEKTVEMAEEARERSPIATFGAEMLLPPMAGPTKIGKSVLKGAGTGALAGAGMGEDRTEKMIFGTGGAALGAAGTFIGNLLSKVVGNPKPTRATALGTPKSKLGIDKGPKSVTENVEILRSKGFLKFGNRKFDPQSERFLKNKKGVSVQEGPDFLEELSTRARDTEDVIDSEVRSILSKNKLKIYGEEFESYIPLLEQLDEVERKLSAQMGPEKAAKLVSEELDKIKLYIDEPAVTFDFDGNPVYGKGPKKGKTFLELDKDVKAQWQSMSDDVLEAEARQGVLPPDVKGRGQVQRVIARNLRSFIIDSMGGVNGKKIADLNRISSAAKNVRREAIEQGIKEQHARGFKLNAPLGTNAAYFGGKIAEGMGATPEGGLSRASFSESVKRIPRPIRSSMEESVKRYPFREGQRVMQDAEGSPALMGIEALLGGEQDRSPQSIGLKTNIMLSDTLIPRSTDWIMEHPNLLKGKLVQEAPELAAQVTLAMERGGHKAVERIMPLIAQQVPHIFEDDDYGAFDGKIIDPDMKQVYTKKIMSDPSLDSYEKAEIIDHLNKTHEVLK